GGTANVIVRIAADPIGSPLISRPQSLIAMNLPSLEKFAPTVKPGGLIVVNATLVNRDPERDDCTVLNVRSREVAEAAGNGRAANFVMLGAYVGATGVVSPAAVENAVATEFAGGKEKFVPANVAAFRAGLAEAEEAR
ncbi:MAG: 2-oxoacid:acceptor oxidoreductase family protein, partial [Planctomycetota bacterium]|nr:2-oxoacid:acceptor oxidoreductase family protein [Planctomycetota bacterium]